MHAQHSHYFSQLPHYIHPWQAFLDDLGDISQRCLASDAILLLADMNGDIHNPALNEFMTTHELHELLLSKFPSLPVPATFQQGSHSGMMPIDGAWASNKISIDAISYCAIPTSPSNHRAIVLDLNLLECIGKPCYKVVRPPGHRLNCALPTTWAHYLENLQTFTSSHHMAEKLDGLFAISKCPTATREGLQAGLETFDKLKSEGMRYAEKHCRRFNTGLVQLLPELNFWRKCPDLWRLVLQWKASLPIKAKYICCLARACQISNPLSVSQEQAAREFQMAQFQYLQAKPNHDILQQEFLQGCLKDPTLSTAHNKAIAHLVSLESLRESYHHVWTLRSASAGQSISAVKYSSPSGPTIAVSHPKVEQVLSAALSTRFTWAHGSPFLQDPLASLVGPFGTSKAAQATLQGTFVCPAGVDNATRQFIEALQYPSLKPQQTHISAILRPNDFIRHWKRAKERTSSSPSGLHFGHYKVAATLLPLAHLHACFTQLVFMTGLSLPCYQVGLQVILEKKAGNIHVDKLCTILLMEGDFNGAMKILIAARMICSALELGQIPDECYSSRQGCTAIQVLLNRALTANVTRQSQAILAVALVDFRTCYDSVAHPPSSITCQHLSAASSVLETIFSTIQNMKIFLQTAHGNSSTFYGSPSMEGLPFQGVCQGNSASPALWLATSIPLIEKLCHHDHVSSFQCLVH